MNKKLLWLPLAAVLVFSAVGFAACNGKDEGDNPPPPAETKYGLKPTEPVKLPKSGKRTTDVFVHDPSVFLDPVSNKYYAFGSHFMVASSSNLITWKQEVGDGSSESSGQREAKKLYGNVNWRTVLAESVKHAGSQMPSTWAPDVNYHEGKYYMYYSLTSAFGSNKSVIGRVSSENVLGPYANEQVIIASPGKAATQPNCIDPELFEDKEGGLWMVYGSHFGGIYMLELENSGQKWGLPKENSTNNALNDGFGKKVWNGARNGHTTNSGADSVVEGPFVFYNNLTDYYYLMTTYGDLNSDYNMHVARSKNPDGPYTDVTGADMATLGNAGTTGGNKIAGNYKFERQGSETQGYAALGHNSVIKDKDGKYFVVYHTRRQRGTSVTPGHSLNVNQLFFNKDGWPVMSPVCYEGETFGTVEEAQLAQTFEVVLHAEQTTVNMVSSEDYALTADKKITKNGSEVGGWTLDEGYYITLTINEKEYKGVVVPGWDMYALNANEGRLCITAVSDEGVSLWGVAGKDE